MFNITEVTLHFLSRSYLHSFTVEQETPLYEDKMMLPKRYCFDKMIKLYPVSWLHVEWYSMIHKTKLVEKNALKNFSSTFVSWSSYSIFRLKNASHAVSFCAQYSDGQSSSTGDWECHQRYQQNTALFELLSQVDEETLDGSETSLFIRFEVLIKS